MSTIAELRQLINLVEEVEVSLRSQRDILKQRGMNLPPMALKTVSSIRSDVEAIENALIEEQTELGQLRALADTTAMINSTLDLNEVLTQAMDVVINLTNAERGYIILKDPESGQLEFRIAREMEVSKRGDDGSFQVSHSILNDVIESGEALLADNAYKDERLQGNMSIANLALRSVLCVPLKYRDDVTGVVYVDNRLRSGVFTDREKNLLVAFANQAAVAIENARFYTNIQEALSEITQIQELMSNVFGSIGSGVIITDHNDQVTTFNRAAASILEQPVDVALGKRIRSLVPLIGADLDDYLARVREQNQQEHLDGEMEMPRGRIAVSMNLSPLKDSRQHTQGVAAVLDDMTEQREREEMLDIITRYLPPQLVKNIDSIAQLGLGGERREVTCVFVDVLPMAQYRHLRPPELMELINHYLAAATEAIHSTKGIIDKYMGNEIMGLFNTQLNPMDDHSLMAVMAALNMRDAFHSLYKELGINPEVPFYRIGMHTGVATLGNVGSLSRRDFSAIGDTINLSHRLLENAKESQILISDDTRLHIEAGATKSLPVVMEERGSIHVKGRAQAVNIYEVFRA